MDNPTAEELWEEMESGPLSDEIDPLVLALRDADIARVLNRQDWDVVPGVIDYSTYSDWLSRTGLLYALHIAEQNELAPLQIRGICYTALAVMNNPHVTKGIDTSNPEIVLMFDALVQAGIATQEQRDMLMGLGSKTISRSEELWGRLITVDEITEARNVG